MATTILQAGPNTPIATPSDVDAVAVDLRYALLVAPVATTYSVPDSWFPITFTHDGTSYTVPLADKDIIVFNSGYLVYDVGVSFEIANFSGDGLLSGIAPGVSSLQFNGVAPVVGETALDATTTATLADRACNAVAVLSPLASLTINFPSATSGRVRDFELRLKVASGVTTAPELVLPQGATCENAAGEAPEIGVDGATTILYFTETADYVFLVKGEVVQTITA